jgi:hypothetical protein
MSNVQSAFAKRVAEAGLTFSDLSFITNITRKRIEQHSMGRIELTEAEMSRVNAAVSHAAVVYTIFKREIASAKATTISRNSEGTVEVTAVA